MTTVQFTLTAAVPADETIAAQSSCAAFLQNFAGDVAGAVVLAAVFGGESLLPSPADEYEAALSALEELSGPGKRPSATDLQAAVERVRAASVTWEASLQAPTPTPAAGGLTVDPSGMVVANEENTQTTPTYPTPPAPAPVPAPQPAPAPAADVPADVPAVDAAPAS